MMNIGNKAVNEPEKKIAIYTLTSELHDENAVAAVTHEFLNSLHIEYDLQGNDYADYGSHTLDLIYVRTRWHGGHLPAPAASVAGTKRQTILPADIGQEQLARCLNGDSLLSASTGVQG